MVVNQNNDRKASEVLDDTKAELFLYLKNRIRLFKLDAFEKIAIVSSQLGFGLLVFAIIGAILFFTLLALAYFLGEFFGSQGIGFAIMAGFSLLVLLLLLLCANKLKAYILNKTILFIQKIDVNADDVLNTEEGSDGKED